MSIHVTHQQLAALQQHPKRIRNICVLAHVDHGKTTLSDNLIASNGLIHPKMVGKLRYLDWRDDEQERGVTMKSSSIALLYRQPPTDDKVVEPQEFLINLIDSPGHVDFCSEVSTAARLSDGALVVVDVCEGVHIQTHAVLRQAWEEHVRPVLVLNKVDRLIMELRLTPSEAYERMKSIIVEVNNIVSTFRSEKYISDVDAVLAGPEEDQGAAEEWEEDENEEDAFAPERGNVVFASAMDGWAFRIEQFAELYATRLGASASAMKKALWGDRYFIPKTKKIVGKKAAAGKLKPMFAQFVLEPLWQVYTAVFEEGGGREEVLRKVIRAMNLSIPPRDLQHKDPKTVLQSVMSRWLPLARAVLATVVECLPDPTEAQPIRIARFLPKLPPAMPQAATAGTDGSEEGLLPMSATAAAPDGRSTNTQEVQAGIEATERAVEICDTRQVAPCVVFVSKMVAVPLEMLPRYGPQGEPVDVRAMDMASGDTDSAQRECFLAFARVFSGVLFEGCHLYILTGHYNPADPDTFARFRQEARVDGLYMMMGRALEPMASVPAGNCVAIRGLGMHILKSATLSTTPLCRPFAGMMFQAAPIVRVAVEARNPADMAAMARGLRLLNRADPFVEVALLPSGEHVIGAAGEIHLQRCIKDLQERFAGVQLSVSPPLVAFHETISEGGGGLGETAQRGNAPLPSPWVEAVTPNGRCRVRVQVSRLPLALTAVLDDSVDVLKGVLVEGKEGPALSGRRRSGARPAGRGDRADVELSTNPLEVVRSRLLAAAVGAATEGSPGAEHENSGAAAGSFSEEALSRIWALGPRRVGPNLLLVPPPGGDEEASAGDSELGDAADSAVIRGLPHVSIKLGLAAGVKQSQEAGPEGAATGDKTPGSGLPDVSVANETAAEAQSLEGSVLSGFQVATAGGPLCEEPLWGLVFTIEATVFSKKPPEAHQGRGDHLGGVGEAGGEGGDLYGPFSGQVITTVKDACRSAVMANSPRLVEALYFCEVSTTSEALGQVYAVLGRRRATVLKEEMREGSATFTVHAHLPVADSFGFADELRQKTSGAASPQLVLSHWSAISEDPFFVPRTEEELEEFGDGLGLAHNIARRLVDSVRRRKGLPVEEKVVEHGSKQRTRARKV